MHRLFRVQDATFKKGDPPFTHCSNWTVTVAPDDNCFDSCLSFCIPDCGSYCDPDCGGAVLGSINRINWEIDFNDESDDKKMTFDICKNAFQTELGGCSTGSEQNHEGFYFKIDPNVDACPPAPSPPPTATQPQPDPPPTEQAEPSPYPASPTANEFRYRSYDENSDTDKAARDTVHNAFVAWSGVMQKAVEAVENKEDKTYDRWFPEKAGENDGRDYVKGVLARLLESDPETPKPQPRVADLISVRNDYLHKCDKKPINAYFVAGAGSFHVCERGLKMPTQPWDVKCSKLGDTVSYAMWTLTACMVHEFFHWSEVGDKAPNSLGPLFKRSLNVTQPC